MESKYSLPLALLSEDDLDMITLFFKRKPLFVVVEKVTFKRHTD